MAGSGSLGGSNPTAGSWESSDYLVFLSAVGATLLFSLLVLAQSLQAEHPLVGLVYPIGGLLAGGFALWQGFSDLGDKLVIDGTPTSTIASLAVGAVEIQGTARPLEAPLRSALTEEDVCLHQLEIEELRPSGKTPEWVTVLELTDHVPFEVDDGSGSVEVSPEGADLPLEDERQVQIDPTTPPPASVRRWAVKQGYVDPEQVDEDGGLREAVEDTLSSIGDGDIGVHLAGTSLCCRRYTERRLAADEPAYVLGEARPRDGVSSPENPDNLVVGPPEGTGEFIVSDSSEAELAQDKRLGVAITLTAALLLIPTSLFGLLRVAGIV